MLVKCVSFLGGDEKNLSFVAPVFPLNSREWASLFHSPSKLCPDNEGSPWLGCVFCPKAPKWLLTFCMHVKLYNMSEQMTTWKHDNNPSVNVTQTHPRGWQSFCGLIHGLTPPRLIVSEHRLGKLKAEVPGFSTT